MVRGLRSYPGDRGPASSRQAQSRRRAVRTEQPRPRPVAPPIGVPRMTALAHVFAAQVEPGKYCRGEFDYSRKKPTLYDSKAEALDMCVYEREEGGYPSARVVRFQLVEVKEEA